MNTILQTVGIGLIGAVGVPLLLYLWGMFLKRERVKKWGRRIGRFLSKFTNQKLGVIGGEQVQDKLASTLDDFTTGIREGMAEDDKSDPNMGITG